MSSFTRAASENQSNTNIRSTGIESNIRSTGIESNIRSTGIESNIQSTGIQSTTHSTGIESKTRSTGIESTTHSTGIQSTTHSTGIQSLDTILGGGFVGLMMVQEDKYTGYSDLVLKYFLSEGLAKNQKVCLCSLDDFVLELPSLSSAPPPAPNTEKLSIAWRYQHLTVSSTTNSFDLSKPFIPTNVTYLKDANAIKQVLANGFVRLCIHSFGSPSWDPTKLFQFLFDLNLLLQKSKSVCMLSVPAHLLHPATAQRLASICNAVISVEAFASTLFNKGSQNHQSNAAYASEYQGLIHVKSNFRSNSYACNSRLSRLELSSLGFKVQRKKFEITSFSLPPEEGDQKEKTDF